MVRRLPLAFLAAAALSQAGSLAAAAEDKAGVRTIFAQETCQAIERHAQRNGLPASFFAGLIWRESLFNPHVVSPKGAQGIAQFMPATAAERGLADPFDPATALAESAKYLTELKARMGSLGLAAAAYNAGPTRVATWLKGQAPLPLETQDYVLWVTGHSAEDWSSAETALAVLPIADGLSFSAACRKLAARGLTAKLPDRALRASGWQALFASGLGITQIKASSPGRTRIVIDTQKAGAAARQRAAK